MVPVPALGSVPAVLEVLQRIVQEVNDAETLDAALDLIVRRVRLALRVDVCSVYLVHPDSGELVLMATQGLDPQAVGRVRMPVHKGVVGLVAERAEPLNLCDVATHARYAYFPETGEERYRGFLGVPIVQHRRVLGVLVVQQKERRRFGEQHAAFLVTLAAQLAGPIVHAELAGSALWPDDGHRRGAVAVRGGAGAPGVAIGIAVVVFSGRDLESVPDRPAEDIEAEVAAFEDAVARVREDLCRMKRRSEAVLPSEERALFDAYVMIVGSDALQGRVLERIRAGQWAPAALRDTIRENVAVFEEMPDPYLRERGEDIRDLGARLLMYLEGDGGAARRSWPMHTILVGENVTVGDLADIEPDRLAGVVSGQGSATSHVAILARALGVPAVMGVSDLPFGRLEGRELVVDGYAGKVFIDPAEPVRREFERLLREESELARGLRSLRGLPAETPDGERVPVYVNSGLLAEINAVFQSDADGIGLYRTEFPFLVRERFPTEEEQVGIYRQVLEAMAPRPVTLRTLDVGGDKPLPYFPVQEENPFLGWRGIRISLDHPELFMTQVRAMLRASAGLGNLRILLPMISAVRELDEAMDLIRRARSELEEEGVDVPAPEVGAMIEVPSAVYLSESLARRVDFVSLGTNDLVQYLLAVDRNNPQVAGLHSSLHPAVLHALNGATRAAHRTGRSVGVCGEMASDPEAVVLLLGMGVDHLSVTLAALPRVKWVVRSFSRRQCRGILEQALEHEDPEPVRALLREALVEAGLGGLVRAGG